MAEPDSLILRKLNQALGKLDVLTKAVNQLVEDGKATRGAVWANGRDVARLREITTELDVRLTTLEIERDDASEPPASEGT